MTDLPPGPAPYSLRSSDPDFPAPPEHIVRSARLAPEHWFSMPDPAWSGADVPPEWAVLGRWRSDAAGEIVEWEANPAYRPSPVFRGWPEPTDPVDEAIQRAATGYGPGEAVPQALASASVAVLTRADGELVTAASYDGEPVVLVFTAPAQLPASGGLAGTELTAAELLGRVPADHLLYLNPLGPVGLLLPPDAVRAALAPAEELYPDAPAEES